MEEPPGNVIGGRGAGFCKVHLSKCPSHPLEVSAIPTSAFAFHHGFLFCPLSRLGMSINSVTISLLGIIHGCFR